MSISGTAIRGIVWSGSSNLLTTLLNLGITVVLARLLTPKDFGTMGMVLIVSAFVSLIADFGLGTAVIQQQSLSHRQLSTFFFLNLFLGLAFGLIVLVTASAIAGFFRDDSLSELLRLSAILYVLTGFNTTFRTLFQKGMRFDRLARVEILGTMSYGLVSILFAWMGFGVVSLLMGLIFRHVLELSALWLYSEFKPGRMGRVDEIRHLFKFGSYVLGERVLNYLNRNLDYILIGRFLGAEALGYYTLAYQIVLVPISKISQVVGRVAYPMFSQIQTDNARIRFGYAKMIEFISLASFPLMGILFLLAPEFVRMIFGARWEPAIMLVRIFCVLGVVECIGTTVGGILYTKNRADIAFRYNFINVAATAASIIVGMQVAGIVGVAGAITLLSFPLAYMWHSKTNALVELSWPGFLRPMRFALLSTVAVTLVVFLLKNVLALQDGMLAMGLFGGAAVLSYFVLILKFNKELLVEVRQRLRTAFGT